VRRLSTWAENAYTSSRCGDVTKIQIVVGSGGIIVAAKFKTFGCGSATAASSYLTQQIQGRSIEEAENYNDTSIVNELCLSPANMHCWSMWFT
jgi:NifU-like protein involved in Fe-S cluster formation